ncbi:MAG: ankyrin repeat domain-containing protein [Candidatus Sericytochromatia bacterium]
MKIAALKLEPLTVPVLGPLLGLILVFLPQPLLAAENGSRPEKPVLPAELLTEQGSGGQTPLHLAAGMGLERWTRLLLDAGAAADRLDAEGFSPLHLAARNGQSRVLRLLLAKHPELVDLPARQGQTPLALAIRFHQREAAGLLLAAGADVRRPDKAGLTPLLLAVMDGQRELLEAIARQGIDVRATLLRQQPDGRSWLHLLAAQPDPLALAQLLHQGLDPQQLDAKGATPLLTALQARLTANALVLIDAGLSLEREPEAGRQAWHALEPLLSAELLEAPEQQPRLLQLLKSFQLSHNWLAELDSEGLSLLHRRILQRDLAAVKFLLPLSGAEQRTRSGQSPLLLALGLKPPPPELVRLLLESDARVKEADAEGNTPLHLAVLANQSELVEMLLPRYQALPVNHQGKTPLDLARDLQNAELIELLRPLYIRNLY